jgi:shikimate dehydrogenase
LTELLHFSRRQWESAPVSSATLIEKCCLVAQPVAGNPTHFMVEQALAQAGLDWRFMSFEVAPELLADAMRGIRALGFHGVKVAEPHQETVLEYLDDLTDRARRSGSVNCVTADEGRLLGDNTEGLALVDLVSEHTDLAGRRVMIIGAGRLARALAVALAQAGVAKITVASRSAESGRRLVGLIESETPAAASLVEFGEKDTIKISGDVSLLVNATSLSTADPHAPLPIEVSAPGSHGVVVDVSYASASTWLTRQAAKFDCQVIDGVELYVRQTALALKTWTGIEPDLTEMRDAAEEFLGL